MLGKLKMERIFCVLQLIQKYKEKKRSLAMFFMDLEKICNNILREIFGGF